MKHPPKNDIDVILFVRKDHNILTEKEAEIR